MKNKKTILESYPNTILKKHFPLALFWDVNPNLLDLKKDKKFIIDRVISRNMVSDYYLIRLERIYSVKMIKKRILLSHRIRGSNNISLLSRRYNIERKYFKNHTEK